MEMYVNLYISIMKKRTVNTDVNKGSIQNNLEMIADPQSNSPFFIEAFSWILGAEEG